MVYPNVNSATNPVPHYPVISKLIFKKNISPTTPKFGLGGFWRTTTAKATREGTTLFVE